MKNIINLYLIVAITALASCNSETTETAVAEIPKSTSQLSAEQLKKMGVTLGTVQKMNLSETLTLNGMVDVPPENIAEISYPLPGFIQSFGKNILEGQYVQKGSKLATIKSMDLLQLQQEYLELINSNDLLIQELKRQQMISAENAGAQKNLQQAENKFKINESLIASYKAKLRLLDIDPNSVVANGIIQEVIIKAPFSGYIQNVNVHRGTNFLPEDILFQMISKNHLHVELKVFEKDAPKIKKGQVVIFEGLSGSGSLEGEVFLVGQSFEDDSKALNVHVHLKDKAQEQNLKPGQYLTAKVNTTNSEVMSIPESAVLREEGKFYVYQLTESSTNTYDFEKTEVTLGVNQNDSFELIAPTNLDKIAISRIAFLAGYLEE